MPHIMKHITALDNVFKSKYGIDLFTDTCNPVSLKKSP